jgi:hypothetical protein
MITHNYILLRVVRRGMDNVRDYCQLVRTLYKEVIREGRTIHFYSLSLYGFVGGSVKLRADELRLLIA